MRITGLKINGLEAPIGYALRDPVLSWRLVSEADDPPAFPDAPLRHRIEIASDPAFEDLLYVRAGSELRPAGQALGFSPQPRRQYYARVSAMDTERTLAVATMAFETGCGGAPGGDWITDSGASSFRAAGRPLPIFRKTFNVGQRNVKLTRARLYITAAGAFEAYLNGKKLGDEYLMPFLTDPRDALQVVTLRMEPERGENCLEVLVGKGWYAGRYGLARTNPSAAGRIGRLTALLAEIVLEYADGESERFVTGSDWQVYPSEVLRSEIYDGEVQDPRARYPEAARPAAIADPEALPPRAVLCDRYSPPLKICEYLLPVRLIRTPRGEQVLDMGQNMAGFLEFEADLPAGTRVGIEYGEILQNGCFYNGNYRTAEAKFTWTSAGRRERVRPHFTYCGFRYARITGWQNPDPRAFRGCVVHSAIEWTGEFSCGHPGLNPLHDNIRWSMKANFFDLPTDCPQRDERLGWTGDAQIFAPCAAYLGDVRVFFDKFLRELAAAQKRRGGGVPNYLPDEEGAVGGVSSVWGDAAVFLPMTLWWHYGDRAALERRYPMMRAWIDYVVRFNGWRVAWPGQGGSGIAASEPAASEPAASESAASEPAASDPAAGEPATRYPAVGGPAGVASAVGTNDSDTAGSESGAGEGAVAAAPFLCRAGFHFGDWLARDGVTPDSMRGGTDEVFVASAWFYGSIRGAAVAAATLEKKEDTAWLTSLGDAVLESIRKAYFTPTGRLAVDTQAGYLLALRFGLAPDRGELLREFDERLRLDRHRVTCGFAAAPTLCRTLAEVGRVRQAYDFLLAEWEPSWLACVRLGATTVWERWNSVLPDGRIHPAGMNSLNHYAFGAVGEFLYAHVLGIKPIEPGFGRALIAPCPDVRLGFARGKYVSVAGAWGVGWALDAEGALTVDLEIPPGTGADVVLPAREGADEERYVLTLGPGNYHFNYRPAQDFRLLYGPGTTLETLAADRRAVALLTEAAPALGALLQNPDDPELGGLRLSDLPGMTYFPHDGVALAGAIREICALPTLPPDDGEASGDGEPNTFAFGEENDENAPFAAATAVAPGTDYSRHPCGDF